MTEDRPAWARRMTSEREARGWSQAEAVRALRAHATSTSSCPMSQPATAVEALGGRRARPSDFYQPIIAATFGTVTHAMFPVRPGAKPTPSAGAHRDGHPGAGAPVCRQRTPMTARSTACGS